jgi:hypothetical protein
MFEFNIIDQYMIFEKNDNSTSNDMVFWMMRYIPYDVEIIRTLKHASDKKLKIIVKTNDKYWQIREIYYGGTNVLDELSKNTSNATYFNPDKIDKELHSMSNLVNVIVRYYTFDEPFVKDSIDEPLVKDSINESLTN